MTRDEIAGVSSAQGGMFAVIPSVVMQDKELSMSARMLYGLITWRCNSEARCWPTNRALGEDLGLSPKRVSALISQLEERGHIELETVSDPATGQILRRYIYPVVKSGRGIPKNEDTPPQTEGEGIPENAEVLRKYKEETKTNTPLTPQGEKGRRKKAKLTEEAKLVLRAYVGEDRELHEALAALIEVRTEKKAVNSERALKALLSQLDRLSEGRREDKLLLLQQSVANSWKSVFPLKGDRTSPEAARVAPPMGVAEW